jgi:hypothetical protein
VWTRLRAPTTAKPGSRTIRVKLIASDAGRAQLKATYRLAGGLTISASRTITITGRRSARGAAASAVPAVVLGRGPRALPDGRLHGDRPARTFRVR